MDTSNMDIVIELVFIEGSIWDCEMMLLGKLFCLFFVVILVYVI